MLIDNLYRSTARSHKTQSFLPNDRIFINWYFVGEEKFPTGTESLKDEGKSCRPVTVTGKTNVSKIH